MISFGLHFSKSAMLSVICCILFFAALPELCNEFGFPGNSAAVLQKQFSTSGSTGVFAA